MRIVQELPGLEGDKPVHRIGGADLCDLLRLSPAALTGLVKRDLAVKLGHDAYDLRETVGRYVEHLRGVASGRGGEEHALTLTGERARLAREQADQVALKNAQARGELVKADDVEREWRSVLTDLRAEFLAMPSRIGSDLAHLSAEDVAQIEREVRDTLTALAEGGEEDAG